MEKKYGGGVVAGDGLAPPLVVVIGTTGAGKSKLAIELAKAIQGEVVSADSMQVYKGFEVATAKVTKEEMDGVPHHLLGEVDPLDTTFNVTKFRDLAVSTIEDIHRRGLVPILVGGTHYYIEAVVWGDSIIGKSASEGVIEEETKTEFLEEAHQTTLSLHEELMRVDPEMAKRLHPKNERKIRRSLEIFRETGRRHSELVSLQEQQMRYNCCFFWVNCEKRTLGARLDRRVDRMIQNGLLGEVEELIRLFEAAGKPLSTEKGIMQSIGYKEFQPYLEVCKRMESGEYVQGKDREPPEVLKECIDTLKTRTRRYAKVQLRWIVHRLEPCAPIYKLDSTELGDWETKIHNPAITITTEWLKRMGEWKLSGKNIFEDFGSLPHADALLVPPSAGAKRKRGSEEAEAKWKNYTCEICDGKVLRGEKEWKTHLKSKGHKSKKRRKDKPIPNRDEKRGTIE